MSQANSHFFCFTSKGESAHIWNVNCLSLFILWEKIWDNKRIISTCCLTNETRTLHYRHTKHECVRVEEGGIKGDVQHQIARLINLSVRFFTVTIKSIPQGAYWEMTCLRPPGLHTHAERTNTQMLTHTPVQHHSLYHLSPFITPLQVSLCMSWRL